MSDISLSSILEHVPSALDALKVIVGAVAGVITAWITTRKTSAQESAQASSEVVHIQSVTQFSDHTFFGEMDRFIKSEVPHLACGCEGRTVLFRLILGTYLRCWQSTMHKFCSDEQSSSDIDSTDPRVSQAIQSRAMSAILAVGEQANLSLLRDGVPESVLSVFHEWWSGVEEHMGYSAQQACNGFMFSSNRARVFVLLTASQSIAKVVMNDARLVLLGMNGRLVGQKFIDPRTHQTYEIKHAGLGNLTLTTAFGGKSQAR